MLSNLEDLFYMWATTTPSPLPKGVMWDEFPQWLENHRDYLIKRFSPVVQNLLDEFPCDFPGDKKVSKKALIQWRDFCNSYQPTENDDIRWIEAFNNLIPYWDKTFKETYVGNSRFIYEFQGWECKADKKALVKAYKLWEKSSAFGAHKVQPFRMVAEKPEKITKANGYYIPAWER